MRNYILLLIFTLFIFSSCEDAIEDDISESVSESEGAFALSDSRGASSLGGGSSNNSNGGNVNSEPGVITAGEWNDLNNWSFWNGLLDKDTIGIQDLWQYYTHDRYAFEVNDKNLLPVVDAQISLYENDKLIWQAKTDNFGHAELWGNLFEQFNEIGDKVIIEAQNQQFTFTDIQLASQNKINLPININTKPNAIDVAFVVDATGSMSDELEYLKTELLDVINRIQSDDASLQLRTGSVFYRDEGDEYVTRVSNIGDDHSRTLDFIRRQRADGGGDYPEAVHTALNDAVDQLSWSSSARTRIIFLLLDAPPHLEPASVMQQVREKTKIAAKKGIKIIPISGSGIDKPTEFLMRFMAIATNGTYVFVTDDSGIGNDHIEPTVGEYQVEFLNDLMVRLVTKYAK